MAKTKRAGEAVRARAVDWTVILAGIPDLPLGDEALPLELAARAVRIALIPHTIRNTTLAAAAPGQEVNLEFDILGKYVARWLEVTGGRPPVEPDDSGNLTMDRLRDLLS